MNINKRKTILIILIALLVLLIPTFTYFLISYLNTPEEPITDNPIDNIELTGDFDIDIFKETYFSNTEEKNTVVSPLSVKIAMSMAAEGTQGQTLTEMQEILGINDNSKNLFRKILSDTSTSEDVELNIANSIWMRDDLTFKNEYIQLLRDYYNAEANDLDFSDSYSVDVINNWVSEKTEEKIPTIIEEIDPLEIAFLVNAIYFNAKWQEPFNEALTEEEEFTLSDKSKVDAQLMMLDSNFEYFEDTEVQAVQLPYGEDGDYIMKVYLPKENDIETFIESLSIDKIEEWNSNFKRMDGLLKLPKFRTEYDVIMTDILKQLGIVTAFDSNRADFSKMIEIPDINVYISRVIHKTFIDVNEEGTEAAAATIVGMVGTAMPPTQEPERFEMIVNRPFLFTIEDVINNQILFIGTILNPNE